MVALLGIPLVGCLLGPIAIACGVLALAGSPARGRDVRYAVAGILIGVAELVVWLGVLGWYATRPAALQGSPPPPQPVLLANAPSLDEVARARGPVRRALRANVRIVLRDAANQPQVTGSGVLVGKSGKSVFVLTNRHVVAPAKLAPGGLTVTLADGSSGEGTVCWLAPAAVDVAVLEVGPLETQLAPAQVDRAARVAIGADVFVIGNPLGYDATYTAGVVSSVRKLAVGSRFLRVYQTQASVNPGNSGGGLYDQRGRLVGIVTWTVGSTTERLGFAIATDGVFDLLADTQPTLSKRLGQ